MVSRIDPQLVFTRLVIFGGPRRCGYRGDGPCARFGRLNDIVRPRERNIITLRVAWRAHSRCTCGVRHT